MSKRLILILALVFVLGIAFSAYAEVQNVKVSGDLEFKGFTRKLDIVNSSANNTMTAAATIARVRIDADLTDNVMTTVRLINERFWGNTTDNVSVNHDNSNIDLDLAYVTMKEFLYSPLSLTVGRQELHFGNDMIVGNSGTNNTADGSSPFSGTFAADFGKRISFDAVRATLDYNPLVVDLVFAQVRKNVLNTDTSRNLYGINASYAIDSNNTVEAFWFERRLGKKIQTAPQSKADTTHNIGLRGVSKSIKNLTLQAEGAYQFGKSVNADLSADPTEKRNAFAVELAATYDMKDMAHVGKYTPTATLLYNYFSGRKNNGGSRNSAWDPMYENQTFGNLANLIFNQTNQHQLGGILTAKPVSDVILKGEYYAYWWDKRNGSGSNLATANINQNAGLSNAAAMQMTDKKFLGQEIDMTATYNYTEDVQFSLMGGLFFPGASFAKEQTGATTGGSGRNVVHEIVGSMKVTF